MKTQNKTFIFTSLSEAPYAPLNNKIKTFREASYLHLPLSVGTRGLMFLRGLFIWFMQLIRVSGKTMHSVAKNGKAYYGAYLFVLTLRSFHHNPILLNFKPRLAHYRQLCNMGDQRFRRLLNAAISLNMASYEGKHLRLFSRTQEKQQYKQGKRVSIPLTSLKQFFFYSIIKHNIKQQESQIKHKVSAVKKGYGHSETVMQDLPYLHKKINLDVTLSVRSAAKLFDVSVSHALDILRGLKPFGLAITQNIVHISKETYAYCKAIGRPNIRFNINTGAFTYVKAQHPRLFGFPGLVAHHHLKKGTFCFYNNDTE